MAKRKSNKTAYGPNPPTVLPKDALHPECEVVLLPKWVLTSDSYSRHRCRQLEKTLGVLGTQAEEATADDDQHAVLYGAALREAIEELQAAIEAGDMRKVAVAAIDVGEAAEKLRCYIEAPYVQQVKRITRKLRAGAFRYDKEMRQEVLGRFDELQSAGKYIGEIERIIRREFKVSPRTLRAWRKSH